jgi:hypothetical protein
MKIVLGRYWQDPGFRARIDAAVREEQAAARRRLRASCNALLSRVAELVAWRTA